MALNVGELFATLGLDSKDFEKGVDKAEGRWGKMTSGLARTAAKGTLAAGAAIAGLGVKGVVEFGKLERGMNEVFTLLPGISQSAMADMTGQVRNFAVEFGTLPDEVVPALYQAISAGVPQDNVFDFLETANKAAVGGVTDLTTAVDGITSVVNAYGSDVVDAAQASDLMFTAVKLGKTDFDQLSKSLFNVIPTASALGVEFGDVTAALATMTAQGTPTSVATTQLRQMLVELSKAGTATADTFKGISGQTFAEFVAAGGNVEQALGMMAQKAQSEGKSIADMFGSVEAGAAALSLTSASGAEAFSKALGEMDRSAGATEKAFDQMDQGVSRSWEKMKAKANETLLTFGEELAPTVIQLVEALLQLGETALPVVEEGIYRVGQVARGVTFIFDAVGDAFGVTDGRAADMARAMEYLTSQMRAGEDPAVALANAVADVARTGKLTEAQWKTLAAQAGLTDARLADVQQTLLDYAAAGEDANVSTEELEAAFDRQSPKFAVYAGGMRDYMRATDAAADAADDMADSQDDLAREVDEATQALRAQHDQMRAQIDPLFKLQDASNRVAEAQAAVNEAVREHGEGSAEHIEAVNDLARANLDLRDAEIGVAEAGSMTREEFVDQQVEMGLTRKQAEILAAEFAKLDGFQFTAKTIPVHVQIRESITRAAEAAGRSAVGGRSTGGIVPLDKPWEVGEGNRPEFFFDGERLTMIPGNRGRVINLDQFRHLAGPVDAMAGASGQLDRQFARMAAAMMPSPDQPAAGGVRIDSVTAVATPDRLVDDLGRRFGDEVRWATG